MNPAADWRLVAAVGVAAGLGAAPFWQPGGGWMRAGLALVLVVTAVVRRGQAKWPGLVIIGVAAAIAGLLVGNARLDAIDGAAMRAPSGPVTVAGVVTESPSDSRGTARFGFDSADGRVLVETPSEMASDVSPGAGLRVRGNLAPAPDWMRADLKRKGIAMVLRTDELVPVQLRRGGPAGVIDRLRDRAFEALELSVPRREAALSRGFVLGDDSDIDERTTEDFRRSGLSHLLAVSGQNVMLLALLAMPLLALLGIGPRARLLWIGVLILLYIPLAGGGPSIQRAGVMGLAGLVALAATRAPSRIYALALAAAVTLALNPRATGDIGWQLSFAAVVGIMLLAGPLQHRLVPLVGSNGWRRALAEGIAVTVAATISTAPLTVFHFERLPVASLLANLVAMPAVAPAMWLGMIAVAAGQINPVMAVPFNLAGSLALAWIARVAEWFGRPGWAAIELTIGTPLELAVVSGLLAFATWQVIRLWPDGQSPVRPARWLPAVALVLVAAALLIPGLTGSDRRELGVPPPGGARIEFLDVGQGDAILIRPAGSGAFLIDGGPPGGDLAGALQSAGVERLSAVILTHPDLDHYGGLLEIFGLIPVDRLLFDRVPGRLAGLARSSGSRLQRVQAGDLIRAASVELKSLWPPSESGPVPDTNSRSIVTLLGWRNFRMLLTGDAEAETVPLEPGPLDALKVPHHGSEDAGLEGLLDSTGPRIAVISVGAGNPHGHPVPEVVEALETHRVETLRTDRDGTVSIVLTPGQGFRVETGR